jgi:hypothetical protein
VIRLLTGSVVKGFAGSVTRRWKPQAPDSLNLFEQFWMHTSIVTATLAISTIVSSGNENFGNGLKRQMAEHELHFSSFQPSPFPLQHPERHLDLMARDVKTAKMLVRLNELRIALSHSADNKSRCAMSWVREGLPRRVNAVRRRLRVRLDIDSAVLRAGAQHAPSAARRECDQYGIAGSDPATLSSPRIAGTVSASGS